jgi:predicted nuclease of predicted toxin-antitoxin system
MSQPLVLDEHYWNEIASQLRELGHDVVAVTERRELRAMTDDELFAWAVKEGRWIVTENVADFVRIMQRAWQEGTPPIGIVYTSNRAFPRSKNTSGVLIRALDSLLSTGMPPDPLREHWLQPPADNVTS